MKVIELTHGQVAVVDDQDFEWLAQWRWNYLRPHYGETGYARRMTSKNQVGKRECILMHRQIMTPIPIGMEIDHINGNGLDNRRCNLRLATPKQNRHNRTKYKNNTSGAKGVCIYRGKRGLRFKASIGINGSRKHIGSYVSAKEAVLAYNKAATELHGKFARLN